MAREILLRNALADPKEIDCICSAIYHHDDKLLTDEPFDEVLKDADVMHHTFDDLTNYYNMKKWPSPIRWGLLLFYGRKKGGLEGIGE
ncbi:hypothetical protein [Selenomonas sp. KH1T6]|uniref:hypothetical protein n=1 Tax=Selenomonas sp. KH1T6 TaxID=3158784 RepID=UPI0008A73357|nr:hypothetical protein SAMN05216583_11824 [Selenomonas ruminantium]